MSRWNGISLMALAALGLATAEAAPSRKRAASTVPSERARTDRSEPSRSAPESTSTSVDVSVGTDATQVGTPVRESALWPSPAVATETASTSATTSTSTAVTAEPARTALTTVAAGGAASSGASSTVAASNGAATAAVASPPSTASLTTVSAAAPATKPETSTVASNSTPSASVVASPVAAAPVAAAPAPTAAEKSAPEARPVISLEEALRRAARDNWDLRSAEAKLTQARTVARKAWSAWLPQVSVGGSYTYNNIEAKLQLPTGYAIRDFGDAATQAAAAANQLPGGPTPYVMVPTGFSDATIQAYNQFGAQLSVNQVIYAPALWPAIQQATLAGEMAAVGTEQARREVLFAVAQLYFGAYGAKRALEVHRAQVEARTAQEFDAAGRAGAGMQPRLVHLRARVELEKARTELKKAQWAYESSLSALASLLGTEPSFEIEPPTELPLPESEQLAAADGQTRPDVRLAQLGVEVARKGEESAQLAILPSVGLQGAYRLSNVTGFLGRPDSWFVTLGLNWTLYDGGLREANTAEAQAKRVEAEAGLQSARAKARDELRRAQNDLRAATEARARAAELVLLASEALRVTTESYRRGTSSYVEVADAMAGKVGAEIVEVAEELNERLARMRLAKAAGAFDPR